jgi:hypothetical protein
VGECKPLVNGREETPEDGKSYVNRLEIEAIVAAAHRLRERHGPDCTIAALTFYKVGRPGNDSGYYAVQSPFPVPNGHTDESTQEKGQRANVPICYGD